MIQFNYIRGTTPEEQKRAWIIEQAIASCGGDAPSSEVLKGRIETIENYLNKKETGNA